MNESPVVVPDARKRYKNRLSTECSKVLKMADDQLDYSAYISYHTMASNTFSLFMGFTFTSMVVFLTWIPDPREPRLQIVLFSLTLLFHVLGYLLFIEEATLAYCVRIAPKLPDKYTGSIVTRLSSLVWYMLGGINVLIFTVWDLPVLAAASAIVGVCFILWARKTAKPFYGAVSGKWVRR
jgi:hypothetical protein